MDHCCAQAVYGIGTNSKNGPKHIEEKSKMKCKFWKKCHGYAPRPCDENPETNCEIYRKR
jgi:hypothetical protein